MNENSGFPNPQDDPSQPRDDYRPATYPGDYPPPPPAFTQTLPVTPPPSSRPPQRGRKGFAAGVLAAALFVGGGAGVGGAAAFNALDDDGADGGSGSATTQTAQVASTPDEPAADGTVEQVAASVLPSVVKLDVSNGQEAGSGSGIVLSSDGVILTNNHVVEVAGESGEIAVSFSDGTKASARILGTDPLTDTAVIQAEGVDGLTPATIGESSNLDVGEQVVAIGSPFGLDATVTTGIVSALDRPVDVGSDAEGNSTTYPAVQTDAAINPGNSGGPLVDLDGHVIGINSSIRTASSGASEEAGSIGLGFAIPIDEVLPIVDQMKNGETPTHARLGISVRDVANSTGAEVTEGAQVQQITDGSAAGAAGLQDGDVITRLDDQQISGADSLVATIRSYRPGDEVTVTFVRGGDEQTTTLTLDSDADAS